MSKRKRVKPPGGVIRCFIVSRKESACGRGFALGEKGITHREVWEWTDIPVDGICTECYPAVVNAWASSVGVEHRENVIDDILGQLSSRAAAISRTIEQVLLWRRTARTTMERVRSTRRAQKRSKL